MDMSLKESILDALETLDQQAFDKFKWFLQQPVVAGLWPLTKRALENVKITDIVDLIVERFPGKENVIMATILPKVNRHDLAPRFRDTPTGTGPSAENTLLAQQMRVLEAELEKLKTASSNQQTAQQLPPPAATVVEAPPPVATPVAASPAAASPPSRDTFLKHASPLSLDPNTVSRVLILSEDNMKVTDADQYQYIPEHPERFTCYPNVLSRESLSAHSYFEVEWRGESVEIAVSYKDINRKEGGLSCFGWNDKSWMLRCLGSDGAPYAFFHNSIGRAVSGPAPSTGGNRFGVFLDHPAGVLCFYCVDVGRNSMSLFHTERTTFTRPLYAGIYVHEGTAAEVCKIW